MLGPDCSIENCIFALDGLADIFLKAQSSGVEFDPVSSQIVHEGLLDILACLRRSKARMNVRRDVEADVEAIARDLEERRRIEAGLAVQVVDSVVDKNKVIPFTKFPSLVRLQSPSWEASK
jgi:hypothetical protein